MPVMHFRNHETSHQSSVEVTKFFSSNSSAWTVPNNLWFVSVGSTCSPDVLHTTDVVRCRKDSSRLKCCDGTFYRLQGSYADPQNSELYMLYVMLDVCGNINSVMLLSSWLLFLDRLVYKRTSLLSCHSFSFSLSCSTLRFSWRPAKPASCVISGFYFKVDENCTLLACYTAK